jgi:hypothetical protein
MRDPRNALRPFIMKETQAAREKLAAAHFDLEATRDAISAAAMRGEGAIRLPLGQTAVELRATEAAEKLLAWCEQNGLQVEWEETVIARPNGLKLRTSELVITWLDEKR